MEERRRGLVVRAGGDGCAAAGSGGAPAARSGRAPASGSGRVAAAGTRRIAAAAAAILMLSGMKRRQGVLCDFIIFFFPTYVSASNGPIGPFILLALIGVV
jgi:hypothetical protein